MDLLARLSINYLKTKDIGERADLYCMVEHLRLQRNDARSLGIMK